VPTEVVSKLKDELILAGFLGSNDFYVFGIKAADRIMSSVALLLFAAWLNRVGERTKCVQPPQPPEG
jgi:hypothetical protein